MSEQGAPQRPFSKLQANLKEIKKCLRLLREILVEIKDTLAIIALILFFVFGVYEALSQLVAAQPPSKGVPQAYDGNNK